MSGKHAPWTRTERVIFGALLWPVVAYRAIQARRERRHAPDLYTRVDEEDGT